MMSLWARFRQRIGILSFTLLVASASAEAQLLGPLSEADEIDVSRTAAAEIKKGLQLLDDDLVTSYISSLGQALAARSERSSLTYTCKVVDSPEINAFALPGGCIYVNRGLDRGGRERGRAGRCAGS